MTDTDDVALSELQVAVLLILHLRFCLYICVFVAVFLRFHSISGNVCVCVRVETTPHSAPPYFTSPILSGPTVINRQWIEFYCEFTTTSNHPGAVFVVQFLFDGMPASNVPDFTIHGRAEQSHYNATLHERYLHGQLDKTVRQATQHGRNHGF